MNRRTTSSATASIPLVISRAPLSLRLVSGVLLALALTLCLTGVARPAMAMAMSAPMASMEQMTGAADAAEQTVGTGTVVNSAEDSCPSSVDDCALPSGVPSHGSPAAQAAPACTDGPQTPVSVQSGGPRSGVPPPVEPVSPPDLHQLCVSRK